MKVKMLTSQSGVNFSRVHGQEYKVSDAEGVRLVRSKMAEPVDQKEYEAAEEVYQKDEAEAIKANKKLASTKLKKALSDLEKAEHAAADARNTADKALEEQRSAEKTVSDLGKLTAKLQADADAEAKAKEEAESNDDGGEESDEDTPKDLGKMNKTELKEEISNLEGITEDQIEEAYELTNPKMVKFIEGYEAPSDDDGGEE